MVRWLANRVLIHEEREHEVCAPEWLMRWAFDYFMKRGTPAVLDVRLDSNSPFIEVNSVPQTWTAASTTSYRWP